MARTGRTKGKENRPLTDAQIRRNITFQVTGVYVSGGIASTKKMNENGTNPFSNSEMRKKYQHKINEANRGRVQSIEERQMRSVTIQMAYDLMSKEERKEKLGKGGIKLRGIKHTPERIEKMRQAFLNYVNSLTQKERKQKFGGTEESRKKMVETRRKNNSYICSEETRKKIQQSCGARTVLQFIYDKTNDNGFGEFVKQWPSRNTAKKEYGSGIQRVLAGTSKHCKGFKFIWKDEYIKNNL